MKEESRISVRVSAEIKQRLEMASAATGVGEPLLVKNCVEALLDYIEEHGSITFPFQISPVKRGGSREIRDASSGERHFAAETTAPPTILAKPPTTPTTYRKGAAKKSARKPDPVAVLSADIVNKTVSGHTKRNEQ